MLRSVLTCLAIITGLAATGAPASAAMVEALAQQTQSGEERVQPGQKQVCECAERDSEARRAECERKERKCPPRRVIIYIPTVQFGADRAYE